MAMATHSRPTYTDRSRLWGVGMADLEDPPPSHFTLHSWNRRCKSSAVSRQQSGQTSDVRPQHISEMLAMRYPTARSARDGGTGGKYWNRSGKVQEHGGWGSAAAGRWLCLLDAESLHRRPTRARAVRAVGRRPGATHAGRLGHPGLPAAQASRPHAVAVPPAQPAGCRSRPGGGAVLAGQRVGGYGRGAGLRDAGPAAVHRGSGRAPAVRADDPRGVAQPSVDRARLELRCENTLGLVLAQPARSAHGSGGFDPLRRRQRGSYAATDRVLVRSEEHTSELQSRRDLVCRLLLEKKKKKKKSNRTKKKQKKNAKTE